MTDMKNAPATKCEAKTFIAEYKLYKIRWLILSIFILYTFSNSFQWGQYVIINNVVVKYYDIEPSAVDWTMTVYMVAYLPLVFPALWLLEKIGIRKSMVLTSAGLCLGSWIKLYASFAQDRFAFALFGQSVGAVSQVLAFGLAARVTGVWFGPNEVSFACSLAVFGDQFGSAVGFYLPALLVENTTIPRIRSRLILLNAIIAGTASLIMLSVLVYFKERPKTPPSAADAMQQKASEQSNIINDLRILFRKKGFILMMVAYGINNGAFNTFVTLFNSRFLIYFPGQEYHVGSLGFLIMLSGIVGSVTAGYYLDRSHKYKETTLGIYFMAIVSMISFIFTLRSGSLALVYVSCILIGFSQIGYYCVAVQLGIEITYPVSECISSSCLLLASHVCGIIFTNAFRYMTDANFSDINVTSTMAGVLLIGSLINALVPSKLRRQNVDVDDNDIAIDCKEETKTTIP